MKIFYKSSPTRPRNPRPFSCPILPRLALLLTCLLFLVPHGSAQTRPCVTIRCPDDIVAECQSSAGAKVDFNVVASSQCSSTVRVVCDPPSGSLFPIGVHTVSSDLRHSEGWRQALPSEVVEEGSLRRIRFSTTGPAKFFRIVH